NGVEHCGSCSGLAVRQHRAVGLGKSLLERSNLSFVDLSRRHRDMGVGKLRVLRDRTVLGGAGLTRFLAIGAVVHDRRETLRLRMPYVFGGKLRPDVKPVGNLFHAYSPSRPTQMFKPIGLNYDRCIKMQ